MEQFIKWFAESKFASWFRAFLAGMLSVAVLEFTNVGSFDFSNWQSWVIVSLSATLPLLLRVINPEDALG